MNTSPRMTHYEFTRIRGVRLQQLEDGMPPFVPVDPDDTPVTIFQKEVEAKKLPFVLVRTLNSNTKIEVNAEDLEIDIVSKM